MNLSCTLPRDAQGSKPGLNFKLARMNYLDFILVYISFFRKNSGHQNLLYVNNYLTMRKDGRIEAAKHKYFAINQKRLRSRLLIVLGSTDIDKLERTKNPFLLGCLTELLLSNFLRFFFLYD